MGTCGAAATVYIRVRKKVAILECGETAGAQGMDRMGNPSSRPNRPVRLRKAGFGAGPEARIKSLVSVRRSQNTAGKGLERFDSCNPC
jgi:hypothetical protein